MSGGAGSAAAGAGPAGYDAVQAPSAQIVLRSPPTALKYDPSVKRWVRNADGTLASVHPVDQEVVLGLELAQKSFRSAPKIGNRFASIRSSADPALQKLADDYVREAIHDPLARKDVTLISVTAQTPQPGRIEIFVVYRNNVTATQATLQVPIG